jgi:hypothetical protein
MKTMLRAAFLSATAFLLGSPAMPAHAAQSYDNCTGFIDTLPATISTQGTWCLRKDLSTSMTSGAAITVATNNVTIDCNDFKLGGLAAGTGTGANGIHAAGRLNLTVRHCNIRGFLVGLYADGGGHLVERNGFDANTYVAIEVYGAGSTIRGNRVIDTGGSTVVLGTAYGIEAADGVDILDNTVNGVAPTGTNATAYGIYTNFNGGGSITGNRVRGLAASGAGTTVGILNVNSGRMVVRDNDLQGDGVASSVGVRCATNQATARDNVIGGFATGVLNCLSSGNTVNPN